MSSHQPPTNLQSNQPTTSSKANSNDDDITAVGSESTGFGDLPGKSYNSERKGSLTITISDTSISSTLGDHAVPIANNSPGDLSVLSSGKRESYKDSKKIYQKQKKRATEELLSVMHDPTVLVMAGWLKVRGTLKSWTKLYCELKPGLLILYKNSKTHKSGYWVGTIFLNICEVIERPSKKDGFCFKLFNPLDQTIWAPRGPRGESFGAIVQPLPMSYLIFRAPSEQAGRNWLKAIEISLKCSTVLLRSGNPRNALHLFLSNLNSSTEDASPPVSAKLCAHELDESEIERHFKDHDLDDDGPITDHEENLEITSQDHHSSDSDSSTLSIHDQATEKSSRSSSRPTIQVQSTGNFNDPSTSTQAASSPDDVPVYESHYVEEISEDVSTMGEESQTEEVADENKSLLWTLLRQVRPGMDLSKVVLPTFILEPRSFLDKLSDYYYHSDILSKSVLEDDPLMRMKLVVKWYLSGFYKKPRGLKKPYNPVLGECFRCFWEHPETTSRTFYIAEQVSHHPPVSAFYITNRKDGYCITGSILAKSRFYGNSVSAILDGIAKLTLLTRGEDYTLTMPYAHCKGILMGTLSLELGGKVQIKCEKTGYVTELEFKLKPFLGGSELCNNVVGKIKLGKETLCLIDGHWDSLIKVKDKRSGQEAILWQVTPDIRNSRLKRYIVPMDSQKEFESDRLWKNVTSAIIRSDQVAATEEKTILEEEQRRTAKERNVKKETWIPRYFVQDLFTGEWIYKHIDSRPWDPRTDVLQYEREFKIQTKTRHKTPTVACRANSIVNIESPLAGSRIKALSRASKSNVDSKVGSVESEHSSSSHVTNFHIDANGSKSLISHNNHVKDLMNICSNEAEYSERILQPIQDSLEKINCNVQSLLNQQKILHQLLTNPASTSFSHSKDSNSHNIRNFNLLSIKHIIAVIMVSFVIHLLITLILTYSKT